MAVEKDLKAILGKFEVLRRRQSARTDLGKYQTGSCSHGRHQAQAGGHERKRRRG